MSPRTGTYTIAQVLDQVLNHQAPDVDLGVEPFGEGLLLDGNPMLLLSIGHVGGGLLMRRLDIAARAV